MSKIALPVMQTRLGFNRKTCDCKICSVWCQHSPEALIPEDIEPLHAYTAPNQDIFEWAETHLRVAVCKTTGLPRLAPAEVDITGRCHWLDKKGRCTVHPVSPWGCAMYDCKDMNVADRTEASERTVLEAGDNSLYARIMLNLAERRFFTNISRASILLLDLKLEILTRTTTKR